jgi:hypothetical protein
MWGVVMHVNFLFVVYIFSLMLLGYAFVSYHYVGWVIIYFKEVRVFVKLLNFWVNVSKTYA